MPGTVVSQEQWLAARKALLVQEKEALYAADAVAAKLRDLPMTLLTKEYLFEGPDGPVGIADLFSDRHQLVVYHFMLGPDDLEGCTACSFVADHIPNLSHLNYKDTTFVVISRAPFEKITAFKERMGWTFPWYSSFGSDFNYDFHVSLDPQVAPMEYNYRSHEEAVHAGKMIPTKGEWPGLSVFWKPDGKVYHTYSTYSRGLELLLATNKLLDVTPLGRQESIEKGTMSWRHHDKYNEE